MSKISENIQYRYEQKFIFEHEQSVLVEHLVKNNPAKFNEVFQERQINNIYLDRPEFKYYSDHIEGNHSIEKVRIRWYGMNFKDVLNPYLEFKIRKGDLRIKKSFALPNFNIEKGLLSEQINELMLNANLPSSIREDMQNLEPKLLNSYSRKYYRSYDTNFRFTIDKDLRYFKFLKNNFFYLNKEEYKYIILELKFSPEFSLKVSTINTELPEQNNDFSKYVWGIEKLYPQLIG